jgi:hypothetical protein
MAGKKVRKSARKAPYERPVLRRREKLSRVTAGGALTVTDGRKKA